MPHVAVRLGHAGNCTSAGYSYGSVAVAWLPNITATAQSSRLVLPACTVLVNFSTQCEVQLCKTCGDDEGKYLI